MSVDAVRGFRDKQLMKERVQAAGLRVPRSRRVQTEHETRAAAEEIGYPLILKPIAGAGSADTYKVTSAAELEHVLKPMRGGPRRAARSTSRARSSRSTRLHRRQARYENVAAYLPKPLEMRTRRVDQPRHHHRARHAAAEARGRASRSGASVLDALGMGDGFTHMEWYLTPKGEAVFGEIGVPPRRRAHRRSDELHLRHRSLPRVGARVVLGEVRGERDAQVQRRDRLQARAGARADHAHRRARRLAARRAGRGSSRRSSSARARRAATGSRRCCPTGTSSCATPSGTRRTACAFAAATGIKMYAE